MKRLVAIALTVGFVLPSAGCLIRTRDRNRTVYRESRSCGPAYHWEDGRCVHNGRGRGNGNGKGRGPVIRDHRR